MKTLDHPKEKLRISGTGSVSDAELLSVFFRKDNGVPIDKAHSLLQSIQNNFNALARMTITELKTAGVNESSAVYLCAAIELGRRRNLQEALDNGQIKGSKDAASYFRPKVGDIQHEEFWVLFLNRRNAIISSEKLSMGGMAGTVIDVRMVLKAALEKRASSMIFCHNHPSGNLEPSDADKKITRQLKEAGAIMEIPVIDHLIVTQTGHFSFADEGLL